jgi:very-short-patch-repair endonuclease
MARTDRHWSPTAQDLRIAAGCGTGWLALRRYAEQRHGVFCRREAAAVAIGRDALRRAVASGRVVAVQPDVFAFAASQTREALWRAAALTAAGALTGLAGCQVWGMLPVGDEDPPVQVAVDARREPDRAGVAVVRVRGERPTERRRIPVLSPARCVLELAGSGAGVDLVERAINEGIVQYRVSEVGLRMLWDGRPGHHGLAPLGRALDRMEAGLGLTRSGGERLLVEVLREGGFRGWRTNFAVGGRSFDVAFVAERVLIELQSFSFHRTRAAQDRDARKAVHAQQHGWTLIPVTAGQLLDDRLWLAAAIGAALDRARSRTRPVLV